MTRVIAAGTGSHTLQARRLKGYAAGGEWSQFELVDELTFSNGTGVSFEPDIAVSDDGETAWVVWASEQNQERIRVMRVDLTGATPSVVNAWGSGFRAGLPPRIAYVPSWGRPIVLLYNDSGFTGAHSLEAHKVDPATGANAGIISLGAAFPSTSTSSGDVPGTGVSINMDFDVDCSQAYVYPYNSYADCLVVAPRLSGPGNTDDSGRAQSFTFVAVRTRAGTETLSNVSADWAIGSSSNLNAIVGVEVMYPTNVFVSSSERITSGTDITNSRLSRHTTLSVASQASTLAFAADPNDVTDAHTGCDASTADGESISAATMFGGVSIAWCASCDGGAGHLEGFSWGLMEGTNGTCH